MEKPNNLSLRLITGGILGIAVISAIFWVPSKVFLVLLSIVFLGAAWEWSRLSSLQTRVARIVYVISLLVLMYLISFVPIAWVMSLAFLWWLVAIVLITQYPRRVFWAAPSIRMGMGYFVLLPSWYAISTLRFSHNGAWLIFAGILLIVCADTGAYFIGRLFGKHKICPTVSPGKTWEGWFGGILVSLLAGTLCATLMDSGSSEWFFLWGIILLINIFSLTGDLFESMLKRHLNLKDSGRLLPGHGGILDRIDSVTAAMPVFLLALLTHYFR